MNDIFCPYCNSKAKLEKKRFGIMTRVVWICHPCGAWVGCHPDTTRPLGTLANRQLRRWRIKAHDALDPIWQGNEMERHKVYDMLRRQFKRDIHIGEADLETCQDIIKFATTFKNWRTK